MKFHDGYLIIRKVRYVHIFECRNRFGIILFPEMVLSQVVAHHLHPRAVVFEVHEFLCVVFGALFVLLKGTHNGIVPHFLVVQGIIAPVGFPKSQLKVL